MPIYHVLSRGVEKRVIVESDKDRLRFVHDLWAFNRQDPTPNYILSGRHEEKAIEKHLVHIHAWCLMPNHYHLLLSPVVEDGIPRFIKKLNMGYTKYFNEKYHRSGALWQGKHKKILIERDAHFLHIPYYIHLNPLDMAAPEWRRGTVRDTGRALAALEKYRWSSHLDYMEIHNFPSVIHKTLLAEMLGPRKEYEHTLREIMSDEEKAGPSTTLEN